MTVRTRFAPSPTGYLHIGGVRTALFNWLFSRQHGGQFLLRIDDTDQQRNVAEALQPILEGFRWLGIDWDEGPEVGGPHAPYFQSRRLPRYQTAVAQLLASGHAYRDFATTEETQAEREAAEREKRHFLYSRRWMAETDDEAQRFSAEGKFLSAFPVAPFPGGVALDANGEIYIAHGGIPPSKYDEARKRDKIAVYNADGKLLRRKIAFPTNFSLIGFDPRVPPPSR